MKQHSCARVGRSGDHRGRRAANLATMNITTIIACAGLILTPIAAGQGQPSDQPPARQQGGPGGGQGGPGGPGGPGGGPAGQGGPGGAQFIQRLMENDTNQDGKLDKDELPAQFAEIFVVADGNKDGFLDAAELSQVASQAQTRRRGGGGPVNFEGAMKQVERGFEGLEESPLDASSKTRDLELVQQVQMGLVGAKSTIATVKMAPQAKAKYGDDAAKYALDMRNQLIDSLVVAIELEKAILAGNQAVAKQLVEKLDHQEHEGHEQFKREEEEGPRGSRGGPPAPSAPAGAK